MDTDMHKADEKSRLLALDLKETESKDSESENEKKQISHKDWLSDISVVVYIIVLVFAVPAQLSGFGVGVEVPLLVGSLPEGWALPSYFALILQLGNIGPMVYLGLNWLFPGKIKDWVVICLIVSGGAICCFLMSFLWSETSMIGGHEHSTAFFGLLTCMSFTDGIAAIVFWAFMANFKSQYISAMFIGQTFGGVIPAIVGLAQGVSEPRCVNTTVFENISDRNTSSFALEISSRDPNFSERVFFLVLCATYIISLCAFLVLQFSARCAREMRLPASPTTSQSELRDNEAEQQTGHRPRRQRDVGVDDIPLQLVRLTAHGFVLDSFSEASGELKAFKGRRNTSSSSSGSSLELKQLEDSSKSEQSSECCVESCDATRKANSTFDLVQLLVACALADGMTSSVIPALASYSCIPYGGDVYSLTVKLMTIVCPFGCAFSLVVRGLRASTISMLTLLAMGIASYIIYLASTSPRQPLRGVIAGDILVVTAHMVVYAMLMFITVSSASTLQESWGRTGLIYGGSFSQLGGVVGAVVMFITINVFKVFEDDKLEC